MLYCEFSKISMKTFFTEHLRKTASVFSFSKAVTGDFLWKKVFLRFAKFQKHFFYRTHLDKCFWLFRATLLKWGYCQQCRKRKTNLRCTVQVYYVFFRQDILSVYVFIGLHCLLRKAAITVEMFCKKRRS